MSSVKAICLAALFVLTPFLVFASSVQEGALPQQQLSVDEMTAAEIVSDLKPVIQAVDVKRNFELLSIAFKVQCGEKILSSAEHSALTDEAFTRLGAILAAIGNFIGKYGEQSLYLDKIQTLLPSSMVSFMNIVVEVSQYDVTPREKAEALVAASGGNACYSYYAFLVITLVLALVGCLMIFTGYMLNTLIPGLSTFLGTTGIVMAYLSVFLFCMGLAVLPLIFVVCLMG